MDASSLKRQYSNLEDEEEQDTDGSIGSDDEEDDLLSNLFSTEDALANLLK